MNRIGLLLLPLLAATLALATHRLPFKLAVPGLCALLLSVLIIRNPLARGARVWAVVAAFVWSMVGDYFLSSRSGHAHYFEWGIAAFFVAHLAYLRYALADGGLSRWALGALLVVFVPYFGLALSPGIESWVLWVAVLLYLLVSCVGLAAAFGLKQPTLNKGLYLFGIGLIVFSDTVISLSEFVHYRALNFLILPTYYLAHWVITASILTRTDLHQVPALSENRA